MNLPQTLKRLKELESKADRKTTIISGSEYDIHYYTAAGNALPQLIECLEEAVIVIKNRKRTAEIEYGEDKLKKMECYAFLKKWGVE